jgi:uncharacterized protein (DUF2237 family)
MNLKALLYLSVFSLIFLSCNLTQSQDTPNMEKAKNVFGEEMKLCCKDPLTGFYRDGFCNTGAQDYGTHIICAKVTDAFLQFSKSRGNDLTQAIPGSSFPGLKEGDKWCLCINRWIEAYHAGVAPLVDLNATHEKALDYLPLELLVSYSY